MRNGRCPPRRPDCVLRAESEDDVVAGVRHAAERGWRIAVASGGHSWSASHLRDDGLLLDVSALQEQTIDAERLTASAGPGLRSSALQASLAPHDLFFPTGHCIGPALGGFLLQGGFGWHSRTLGPACASVTAIDVVTAGGELVRADADRHSDLFWAARGAGPGFFGAVTRFHLRLHRRPRALVSSYAFALDALPELMRWTHAVARSVPRSIELMVFVRRGLAGGEEPALQLLAPALADSEEQARADLAFVAECPLAERAVAGELCRPTDVVELVHAAAGFYPEGARYAVDNMWTHAAADELLDGYETIARTLPPSPSHMMWMNWSPPDEPRPDMAYSLEDDVYLGLYGIWTDPSDDVQYGDWPTERMRELEPLSSGIQLADENLGRRRAPFLAPDHHERLAAIRARYDPEGRFHSWMASP